MAQSTGVARLYIDGNEQPMFLEYPDVTINISSGGVFVNPSVDLDLITLTNEAAFAIIDYFNDGNVYEGLGAKLEFTQGSESLTIEGYIDLNEENGFEIIEPDFLGENPVQCRCKFVVGNDVDKLEQLIEGNNYLTLRQEGVFTQNDYTDLDFVIEDDFDPLAFFMTVWVLFSMSDKLNDLAQDLAKDIAELVAMAAQLPNGAVVAVIYKAAVLIIRSVYAGLLIVLMIDMLGDLAVSVSSPVYTHRVASLYDLLRKPFEYWGYKFDSPIDQLHKIHYVPAKPSDNSANLIKNALPFPPLIRNGVPKVGNYGFRFQDMLNSVLDALNAVMILENNTVRIVNDRDEILEKNATVTLEDVLFPTVKYNSHELNRVTTLEFVTDVSDKWTSRNYEGTFYGTTTKSTAKSGFNKKDSIKGMDERVIQVGLCNRKDSFTIAEEILKNILSIADDLLKLLGSSKKVSKFLTNKIGVAKFSDQTIQVPRWVYLEGGRIPANHRELLSAEALFKEFHKSRSWIADNYKSQEAIFDGVNTVPFNLQKAKSLVSRSKVNTAKGLAKVVNCSYTMFSDYADFDLRVQRTYTKNIEETESIEE